jgi:hypothetical protein
VTPAQQGNRDHVVAMVRPDHQALQGQPVLMDNPVESDQLEM